MDLQSYLLESHTSNIDHVKLYLVLNRLDKNERSKANEIIEYVHEKYPTISGTPSLNINAQEKQLLDRLEEMRQFELDELIRLELLYLTTFYINHLQWDKGIRCALEEDKLSVCGRHKFWSLGHLLVCYMAKRDYVRAADVADNIQSLFGVDPNSDAASHWYFFSEDFDELLQEEIRFYLTLLTIIRNGNFDYLKALTKIKPLSLNKVFTNQYNIDGYTFLLSIVLCNFPPKSGDWIGDVFEVLRDASSLNAFIAQDPWLSSVADLSCKVLANLASILNGRLKNIQSGNLDEQLATNLLSLF